MPPWFRSSSPCSATLLNVVGSWQDCQGQPNYQCSFIALNLPIIIIYFPSPKITDTLSDITHPFYNRESRNGLSSPPLLAFSQTASAPAARARPPSALGTKSMTKWIPKRRRGTAQGVNSIESQQTFQQSCYSTG